MKKLLLFLMLSGLTASGFAQKRNNSLGLVLAPNIHLPVWPGDQLMHFGAGLFYDQDLTSRIGLSTGVKFLTYHHQNSFIYITAGPAPLSSRLYNKALEVPLNLIVSINPEGQHNYRSYFVVGYAHRYLLSSVHKVKFPDRVITDQIYFPGKDPDFWRNGHFLNFGMEVRRNVGANYTGALGAIFGYGLADQENCLFQVNLKFGRNLRSGKNF